MEDYNVAALSGSTGNDLAVEEELPLVPRRVVVLEVMMMAIEEINCPEAYAGDSNEDNDSVQNDDYFIIILTRKFKPILKNSKKIIAKLIAIIKVTRTK